MDAAEEEKVGILGGHGSTLINQIAIHTVG